MLDLRTTNRSRDCKTLGPVDQDAGINGCLFDREGKGEPKLPFPSRRKVEFTPFLIRKFCQPRSDEIKEFLLTYLLINPLQCSGRVGGKSQRMLLIQFYWCICELTSEVPYMSSWGIGTCSDSVAMTRLSLPPNCTLNTRKFVPPRSNA